MSTPRNKQASWFKKAEHVKLAKSEVRKSSIDLGAFSIAFTGLTSGSAQIGNHLSISYTIDPSNGTETVAWGTAAGDSTYGTGANPTDFTAGDGGNLVVTVTDGGETLSRSAPIRYAFGTAPSIAAQVWVVDTTVVNLNAAATGANLTFSYSAVGLPTGLTINSATGVITGTPTIQVSGNIQVTAVDQYGSALVYAFSYQSNFRSAAVAANGLGPFSWTVDDTSVSVDATTDFTTNGNTLTYTATGLPAGVTIASNGIISGTPTAASSGTIVVTGQDEYGRETTSTTSHTTTLRAQATGGVDLDLSFVEDSAIIATNLAANWTANGNTLTYSVSPALPAGLSMSTAASLTGTPTAATADATYTLIGTDEYGRQTSDTFTLEITATTDVTAPVLSGAIGTQTGQTTATWSVTSNEANGTIYAGVRPTASAALTSSQLIAGAGGSGVAWNTDATPTADGNNGGSFTGLTAATAYRVDVVQVDAAGNTSVVVSSAEFTTASVSASFADATGGTETEIDVAGTWYRVHTFTSSGTLTVNTGGDMEYLVVAGGGSVGGGATGVSWPAGGGGGEVLTGTAFGVTTGAKPITIGAGGAGPADQNFIGSDGNFSSALGVVADGGYAARQSASGETTAGQGGESGSGFAGGVRTGSGGGGGGGAGGAGSNGVSNNNGGDGGVGVSSSISGTATGYGGGGGGGGWDLGSGSSGSATDGGGDKGPGIANRGGGGGCFNTSPALLPAGGSGIVIIRYEIAAP